MLVPNIILVCSMLVVEAEGLSICEVPHNLSAAPFIYG